MLPHALTAAEGRSDEYAFNIHISDKRSWEAEAGAEGWTQLDKEELEQQAHVAATLDQEPTCVLEARLL